LKNIECEIKRGLESAPQYTKNYPCGEMATRTALRPNSLRYRLRNVGFLRRSISIARRPKQLPTVIPSYVKKLGLEGLRIFLVSAMSRNQVLVAFPGISEPVKIRPGTSDKKCFEQIFLEGDYKLEISCDPSLILDGGANVGYASIFFANHYPHASILAVEPEPANFSTLLSNIQSYPQIKAVHAAIWCKPEPVVVNNPDQSWAAYVVDARSAPKSRHSVTVQGLTIGDLLQMSGKDTIDILKLDVEGAEREIFLSSDCSWLRRTKILIVELHDRLIPGCTEALEKALSAYSFRRMVKGENTILINNDLVD
jgi:FkbM family methyltransferase